jgi:hypothetical protein
MGALADWLLWQAQQKYMENQRQVVGRQIADVWGAPGSDVVEEGFPSARGAGPTSALSQGRELGAPIAQGMASANLPPGVPLSWGPGEAMGPPMDPNRVAPLTPEASGALDNAFLPRQPDANPMPQEGGLMRNWGASGLLGDPNSPAARLEAAKRLYQIGHPDAIALAGKLVDSVYGEHATERSQGASFTHEDRSQQTAIQAARDAQERQQYFSRGQEERGYSHEFEMQGRAQKFGRQQSMFDKGLFADAAGNIGHVEFPGQPGFITAQTEATQRVLDVDNADRLINNIEQYGAGGKLTGGKNDEVKFQMSRLRQAVTALGASGDQAQAKWADEFVKSLPDPGKESWANWTDKKGALAALREAKHQLQQRLDAHAKQFGRWGVDYKAPLPPGLHPKVP